MSKPDPERRLTDRQRELMKVIDAFIKEHQYPPSRMDIVKAMGYANVNSIGYMLESLRFQGYLTWERHKSRTFRILKRPD